jgi:hypothetical protein
MKIGVVIPSRLALRPEVSGEPKTPWLKSAIDSVRGQSCHDKHEWLITVGLDKGQELPTFPIQLPFPDITFIWGDSCGQAQAVNRAARECVDRGVEVMAVLEDDDSWHSLKMEIQLGRLGQTPFSSCSQKVVSEDRKLPPLGVNDYPIPSGWVMTPDVWKRIGGFDEGIRYLVDTEWLGRLNKAQVPRLHFVENRDAPQRFQALLTSHVAQHAEIVPTGLSSPLVDRTQNLSGGMASLCRDSAASAVADTEQRLIIERYGENPW